MVIGQWPPGKLPLNLNPNPNPNPNPDWQYSLGAIVRTP